MNGIELLNGVQVMDSRDIAELTGKAHADVCRDIRVMAERLGVGESKIASSYRTTQGKQVTCYKLPRRECLILVSGYKVELRAAIIDRWEALETGRVLPAAGSSLTTKDLELIGSIVAQAVVAIVQQLDTRVSKLEERVVQPQAAQVVSPVKALPARTLIPEIPVRKQVANVVADWVAKRNKGKKITRADFEAAYHKLYKNFGDRYGINVEVRAANRGIKPVEFLEREGKLEELFLCALMLYGEAA